MKLKFKFTHRISPVVASLLLAVGMAYGDTITLKSGEKLEGKVLSETDAEVILEYNLTPKIKDKKTILKTDIQEMVRLTPSQLAFAEEKMSEVVPTADLLSGGDYERIIQDKLRTFVAKYPGTPEAAEVEKMIATLSEEKARVVAGEVKMEGKWLDAESARRESYNIDAYRTRSAMKQALIGTSDTRLRDALRQFEKLRTLYPSSVQYVDAIPEGLEIIAAYQKQLVAMAAEQPVIQQQRQEGLKTLSGPEQGLTKASIDQEERAFKAAFEGQTKQKLKWRDVYKYDIKSIQSALETASKEVVALKSIDLNVLRQENMALGAAIGYIAAAKPAEADAELDKVRAAKSTLINKAELTKVEKELRLLKERVKAQQKAAGALTVSTGNSAGEESTSTNPIEEAMRQREKERQEKASGGKTVTKSTKTVDDEKGDKESKTSKSKSSSEKPRSSAPATPEPEPGMLAQINDYIPYIGGGLLLILVLAMAFGKKKKADA